MKDTQLKTPEKYFKWKQVEYIIEPPITFYAELLHMHISPQN
jgi:hypothetical protein